MTACKDIPSYPGIEHTTTIDLMCPMAKNAKLHNVRTSDTILHLISGAMNRRNNEQYVKKANAF